MTMPRIRIELAPGVAECIERDEFRVIRGKECRVSVVNADGTTTPIPMVRSVSWRSAGRLEPVVATIVCYADPPCGDVPGDIVRDPAVLADRLNRLETENAQLRRRVAALEVVDES